MPPKIQMKIEEIFFVNLDLHVFWTVTFSIDENFKRGGVSGHESQKIKNISKSRFTEITTKIEDLEIKICHIWEFHKSRWINKRHKSRGEMVREKKKWMRGSETGSEDHFQIARHLKRRGHIFFEWNKCLCCEIVEMI